MADSIHSNGCTAAPMLANGGGERVWLGKALAELEIQLLTAGLLKQLTLALEGVPDLTLKVIPSPKPAQGPRAGTELLFKAQP